ncbi:hypothetical protein [Fusibacter tunisiensis]|uniref:Uncharacterized protein n=1 Tax=Fusibacter tunisiensis TaxID=1008308 RepID=A0ABS2MP23_9FIRM|nr:hypothetical protein [Fusibacter tunisiensis]MBM7561149.1 hypothetical protein [Fusibacter tunisiensis]
MKKHISVLLTIGLLLLSFPSYAQPIASDVPFNVVKDTGEEALHPKHLKLF